MNLVKTHQFLIASVVGFVTVWPSFSYANNLQFETVSTPKTASKAESTLQVSPKIQVGNETQSLSYRRLLRVGERDASGEIFGAIKDRTGQVLKNKDGTPLLCNGTQPSAKGSGVDHISILQRNGRLFAIFQFECGIGALYKAELLQSENGELSVKPGSLAYISQDDYFGGWVHCAGSTTPWQSHLGSEEYEPDARYALSDNGYGAELIEKYWRIATGQVPPSPYYYGWMPEVRMTDEGKVAYQKHYAMGRFSHELGLVMPDQRTVYLTDDGGRVGLFMFVADKPRDLSQGYLYAAKWQQVSGRNGGQANLSWVSMGHASNADIDRLLNPDQQVNTHDAIQFEDIFDKAILNQPQAECEKSGGRFIDATGTCLKLKDLTGDGKVLEEDIAFASRLETRRMADYLGATVEFKKEEGLAFNRKANQLYISMSVATGLMADNKGDIQLENHGIPCGVVYQLEMGKHSLINSAYVGQTMSAILTGRSKLYTTKGKEPDYAGNECDINQIAEPDNLAFIEESGVLIIGEDTNKGHLNDAVWAYHINKPQLSRIATMPYASESTSPNWIRIGNFGYISLTIQHPFSEKEFSKDKADLNQNDLVTDAYAGDATKQIQQGNGVSEVGYIGPIQLKKSLD